MDSRTKVKIDADASGVESGSEQSKSALSSLRAFVQGLTDSFLVLGGAAAGSFREIRTGAQEASESVKGAAAAVTEFREMISGVGEALIAAFAVEQIAEFAKKMGETAEQTYHTALAFGLTTSQVQEMKGQFTALGLAPEAGIQAMMRLDRAFATAKAGGERQAEVFRKLGVDINGAYTQSQLFERAIQGLSSVPAGPARVADAMQLFGRNIQNIAPLLGVTKEQLAEVNKQLTEFDARDDEATQKGLALAEALNTNKLAGQGLMNVLTDALAPAITKIVDGINELVRGFIQSYQQGGIAKTIMDLIAGALRVLETALVITGGAFAIAFDVGIGLVRVVADLLVGLYNLVKGPVLAGIGAIGDAWHSISGPVMSVIRAIVQAVADAAGAVFRFLEAIPGIGPAFRAVGRDASAALANIVSDAKKAAASVGEVWSSAKLPPLPKAGPGTTADDPTKVTKTKGPGIVQQWEEELHRTEILSNDFFGDETSKELAFWQGKLALVKAKSKEWYEVQDKIYQLSKTLAQRQRQDALDDAKQTAEQQIAASDKAYQAQRTILQDQAEAVRASRQEGNISLQDEYAALLRIQQQEQQAQEDHENTIYQIKLREKQRELELYATDPINRDKVNRQIETLEIEHQGELTDIVAKGVADRHKLEEQSAKDSEKLWQQRIGPIVSSFNSGLKGLLTGTMTWRQALGNILDSVVGSFVDMGTKMLSHWIAKELAQTSATAAGAAARGTIETAATTQSIAMSGLVAIKDVANAAARAAAHAYAAIAAIPVVGPFLAPAAAGVALAAVFAIGKSIVSARGGLDQVQEDGQQAILHKDETVLSAQYARPLRKLLTSIDFGSTGSVGGLGAQVAAQAAGNSEVRHGDQNFYYQPTVSHHDVDVDKMLEDHGDTFLRWMRNQHRNGSLRLA